VNNHNSKKPALAFAGTLATHLGESLTQALGNPLQFQVLDSPDLAKRQGKPVHFQVSVSGKLTGDCFIEMYEPQVIDLGSKLLPEPATTFNDAMGEAVEKVIASATEGLSASLAEEYGTLTFKVARVAGLAFGGMLVVPLATSGEHADLAVVLYVDGKLLESFAPQPASTRAETSNEFPINPANLKLVMDVELNVTLRFGQRQMPLREVLELASGSVIELDRQVDEPVELLLDGKLIARGEAVIVDGNYGLRVTEIPQPPASHFAR
jgi:flagellar motor switch protein FliN/FliY